MRLALELPTAHLEDLSALTDCDFALAQNVLEDSRYADFYKEQAASGHRVILDNGFHEMGRPLSISELKEAYDKIGPTFIIAPDWLGDLQKSYDGFVAAAKVFPKEKLAVVMQGGDPIERSQFFSNLEGKIGMLCFPFRAPRYDMLMDLLRMFPRNRWPDDIHLLGVNEFWELSMMKAALTSHRWSEYNISVDTAKPIKFGIQQTKFKLTTPLRNSPVSSADIHRFVLSPDQLSCIYYNIAYLRRFC